jgi:hypothetical protein
MKSGTPEERAAGRIKRDPCLSPQGEFGSLPTRCVLRRAAEAQAEAVPLSDLAFLVTFLAKKVTRHARASPGAEDQSKANIPSAHQTLTAHSSQSTDHRSPITDHRSDRPCRKGSYMPT